ncbi:hypothetical protein MNBD_BACTEROID03-1252 [hydrothermal vent metagenome]|uniref:Right handed beta helix domain-containing protein n=1 Tax=hydrothermal vent metagenome TaxID=652676 RepID=A0A3B0T423_9ZZZZ
MKITPLKVVQMTMLFIVFSILFSCSKDTDLLLDSVLNEPVVSIEDKNSVTNEPSDEEGFVIRTFAFSPTNDAYLQAAQGHDRSIIRLQEDYRTSYLMFDLSEVNGPITDAVLQFSIDSDEGDGIIDISKGNSNEWTEKNLTENNAPVIDVKLGSMNKAYKVGAPEKVALSATNIQAELTTLVMTHSTGNDLAFASKEHPTNKGPLLIITYKAPEGSPEIEPQGNQEEEEDNPQPKNEQAQAGYFVTTSGKASNDGLSEATAWSIEYAFDRAIAGDIVYIKAGDYGSKELVADNSGTADKPIKFIGYTNTPGDLVSNEGSTFSYGNQLDPGKMPLIKSTQGGTGIFIQENFVEIENFQITRYRIGLVATGRNLVLRNIIATDFGTQSAYSAYDGFGIQIKGNNCLLENSFVLNATAEAIKLYDSDYSRVNYCQVYADNPNNPTDYYFLLTGGTNNTLIENSYAERAQYLKHGGHGFDMKDLAENNTFRNCTAKRTSFEFNFSGVRYNTIEDCFIYGVDTTSSNWHAVMVIFNGANNNLIKNMYIQDTWRAIAWGDYDDGYVGPGGDRDEVSTGYDNTFDNITIRNTNRILNVGGGTNFNAWAKRNTFVNCDFSDFGSVAVTYYPTEDILFKNCKFNNGGKLVTEAKEQYAPYSRFDVTWENCTWSNVGFTPPN